MGFGLQSIIDAKMVEGELRAASHVCWPCVDLPLPLFRIMHDDLTHERTPSGPGFPGQLAVDFGSAMPDWNKLTVISLLRSEGANMAR